MNLSPDIRRRARALWQPLAVLFVLGYFGFHAIHGDRGLIAYHALCSELKIAQAIEADAKKERDRLQTRVSALRPESLDPDMLEERALALLNFGTHDDIIVLRTSAEVVGQ